LCCQPRFPEKLTRHPFLSHRSFKYVFFEAILLPSTRGDIASQMPMARKKISTTIYITPEQNELLKVLNQKTKVPVAEYIRQGIDLVLERYKDQLPGQSRLPGL
jgi:hypothetical protein